MAKFCPTRIRNSESERFTIGGGVQSLLFFPLLGKMIPNLTTICPYTFLSWNPGLDQDSGCPWLLNKKVKAETKKEFEMKVLGQKKTMGR